MHVIPARPVVASLQAPHDPVESWILLAERDVSMPRYVAGVAGAQGGNVTRAQLLRLGCSFALVGRWNVAGRLIRVHQGVYAVGHLPRTHHSRWWAAILACGEDAGASHRVAAAAMGLMRPHPRVDVTAPTTRKRPGIVTHRADIERVYVDGLPCTTVARTLVDLAACVPFGVLEGAVRQAQVRGLLDLEEISDVVRAYPRPRGMRQLRAILDDPVALAPTRSAPERVALRALLAAGWRRPVVNGLVHGTRERVDFHWPHHRLVLEIDGPTHLASSVQRARDARRDALLRTRGWRVVRLPDTQAGSAPQALIDATTFT